MEESLYKINLQVKKLPRAIASKSTEVPEESGGNNNNNNNNNNTYTNTNNNNINNISSINNLIWTKL